MVTLLPLFAATWVFLGTAISAAVQSYAQRDLFLSLTALPIILSAPLFYSLDSAPTYLRWIAKANPLSYQVDALRAALAGTTMGSDLIVNTLLFVITLGLAYWAVGRSELLTLER